MQVARDPRFDTAVKGVYDEKAFKKNYSFLNDYREDEMKALKQEISKSKDERKKEQLKKELLSMVFAQPPKSSGGCEVANMESAGVKTQGRKRQGASRKRCQGAQEKGTGVNKAGQEAILLKERY